MRARRMTAADRRRRAQDRLGWALLTFTMLGFVGLLYAAYRIDAANGITPCQSLANWGMHVCA